MDAHKEHLGNAQNDPDPGRRSPAIIYAVRTPGDALHSATDRGDFAGINRILQASPDCVDARNARGRTSLHVAAMTGRNDIVKHLLQYGANVNARSGWMYTPLIFAAENIHPEVVVTLVRAGAHLEARTKGNGNTALHRAVLRKNNSSLVYVLAVFGADVNTKNDKGDTVLYTSIAEEKDENALVLCAFGADPTIKSTRGETAANLMKKREVKETQESQVDMSRALSTWTSQDSLQQHRQYLIRYVREDKVLDLVAILCWACSRGYEKVLDFVLQLSGDKARSIVNEVESMRGWKPLHYAVAGSNPNDMSRLLLTHGATVDALTYKHKWTPLLLAAENGRQRTVACLLENGADILAETHQGKTAFELAMQGGHAKTLSILGERSIYLEDHSRRQAALERFTNAKFALEHGGGMGPSNHHLEKPRSRSPMTKIGSDHPQRGSESEFREPESSSYLKPGPKVVHDSRGSRDPSPSSPIGDNQSAYRGSFDGLYSLPTSSSNLIQSDTFDRLIDVWDYFDYKEKHDQPVKIAILDTGLDISHSDFSHPRAVRFQNAQPIRAEGEPCQRTRVRAWKDFTVSTPPETKTDMLPAVDLDGHGTQVASLILRLAPRSDLYIARICEGDVQRGALKSTEPNLNPFKTPQPDVVAAAIEWAIQQGVNIINMSFGFSYRLRGPLKSALKKAAREHILVFAAMSNSGNNNPYGAAWPASDSGLTIGIHSCQEAGKRSSSFSPPPVASSHNFMVVGEQVLTHWPETKGGGFRLDEGTSFATPVAASMAALILAFERQHLCKKNREEAEEMVDLDELRELHGMGRVLRHISVPDRETGHYSYIYPSLLWKDFNRAFEGDRKRVRKHAWDVIQDALSR